MTILLILPGNPVNQSKLDDGVKYYHFPSLIEGHKYFNEKQIINNLQTCYGIRNSGCIVHAYYHTKRNNIYYLFRSAVEARKLAKSLDVHLTHVFWGGLSGLFIILFSPKKTVVSLLGSDLFGSIGSSLKRVIMSYIQRISSQLCVLLASGSIVMSERMRSYLWKVNKSKCAVIPEGIDADKFTPGNQIEARHRLGWNKDSYIIIFFDDGHPVKNLKLAIKSFERFRSNKGDVELKLIKGFNHEDMVFIYRAADVLLITSVHEGSNNSIKEALACDLSVISVPCGDAEQRILNIDNCFICEYNVESITHHLDILYNDRGRSNGSKFVNRYTIENVSLQIKKFYEEI